jgi:hypothetical protein
MSNIHTKKKKKKTRETGKETRKYNPCTGNGKKKKSRKHSLLVKASGFDRQKLPSSHYGSNKVIMLNEV